MNARAQFEVRCFTHSFIIIIIIMTRWRLCMVRCDGSPRCPRSSALCQSVANVSMSFVSWTTRKSSPVHTWAAASFHCNDLLQGLVCRYAGIHDYRPTCPNSAWRFLSTMSVMFGRPVVSAMSTFFTWSCHLTSSIWRWHPVWKDCSLRMSFTHSRDNKGYPIIWAVPGYAHAQWRIQRGDEGDASPHRHIGIAYFT